MCRVPLYSYLHSVLGYLRPFCGKDLGHVPIQNPPQSQSTATQFAACSALSQTEPSPNQPITEHITPEVTCIHK